MGLIYYEGKYIQHDIDKAIDYFRKAANNDVPESQFFLGMIYFLNLNEQNQNIEKGIEYLIQSSQNGFQEAQFIVGILYHEGRYIQRDIKKAVHLYKELSSLNNNFAKNNLGVLYRNGFGDEIHPNIGYAIEYFKEAIREKNDILSKYNLSITYLYDIPLIDDNENKSIELLLDLNDVEFTPFTELLCLSLVKKYGFNITIEDINHELEKHANIPISKAYSILNMIKNNKLNESYYFEEKYLFYKNQNFLYDFRKDYISLNNFMKQNTLNDSNKKSKNLNISKDFFEGFGIDLNLG